MNSDAAAAGGAAPYVLLLYSIISGNTPSKMANWAGIWNGDVSALWSSQPISTGTPPDYAEGQIIIPLESFPYGTYTVAYSTAAPGAPAFCSTLSFRGTIIGTDPFTSVIAPVKALAGNLTVSYQTPLGNSPAANNNWIGLWAGQTAQFNGGALVRRSVQGTGAAGTQVLDVALTAGEYYTLAYSSAPEDSAISATCTFYLSAQQ